MATEEKPLLLVFPMELASHYLRCLALCKRLEKSFNIEIAASTTYRSFIGEAGLKTFKVSNFDHDEVKTSVANFDFSWLNRQRLLETLESQMEIMAERKPYAVLGDTSFALKMAAEKTGTRFVSLLNGYMTKYYGLTREVPRSHPGYRYSKHMPPAMFGKLASVIEHRSMKSVHEPFRQIRGELGLKSAEYLLDELEGDLNLICDLPDFFPQRDAPSSYKFIGPLYHSNERDELEVRNFLKGPEKKILITMGSTGNWEKLSVLEHPDFDKYRFVLSSDRKSTVNIRNSLTRQFINQTAILPKIDLVICHGGNGTIYQALSCGVPVLCLPANFEAEWNSNRVQALGYGEVIESSYGPAKIDSMVQFWLKMRDTEKMQSIADRIMTCTKMPLSLFQVAR